MSGGPSRERVGIRRGAPRVVRGSLVNDPVRLGHLLVGVLDGTMGCGGSCKGVCLDTERVPSSRSKVIAFRFAYRSAKVNVDRRFRGRLFRLFTRRRGNKTSGFNNANLKVPVSVGLLIRVVTRLTKGGGGHRSGK